MEFPSSRLEVIHEDVVMPSFPRHCWWMTSNCGNAFAFIHFSVDKKWPIIAELEDVSSNPEGCPGEM